MEKNNKETAFGKELPLGLGMAFAQNTAAMERFSVLPQKERESIINKAMNIKSREEMQTLVDNLGAKG